MHDIQDQPRLFQSPHRYVEEKHAWWLRAPAHIIDIFVRRTWLISGPGFAHGHFTYDDVKQLLPGVAPPHDRGPERYTQDEMWVLLAQLERAYGRPSLWEVERLGRGMCTRVAQEENFWYPVNIRRCPGDPTCDATEHMCMKHETAFDRWGQNYELTCHSRYFNDTRIEHALGSDRRWRAE